MQCCTEKFFKVFSFKNENSSLWIFSLTRVTIRMRRYHTISRAISLSIFTARVTPFFSHGDFGRIFSRKTLEEGAEVVTNVIICYCLSVVDGNGLYHGVGADRTEGGHLPNASRALRSS